MTKRVGDLEVHVTAFYMVMAVQRNRPDLHERVQQIMKLGRAEGKNARLAIVQDLMGLSTPIEADGFDTGVWEACEKKLAAN